MEGWRAAFLALLAGAASALALAPFHWFPVLFITIPLFVWLLDGAVASVGSRGLARFWPAFRTGWLFGFGYFLAGLWWIGTALLVDAEGFLWMLPFAVVGFPACLAIFWGIAMAVARLAWGDGWVRLVAFAAALTLAEFVRGTILTGFPWNLPGYAFMPNAMMMQSAEFIGAYGVTFFTLFIAAAPAIFAPGAGERPRRMFLVLLSALVLFGGHIGWGFWSLSQHPTVVNEKIKIRLVQPNIDQVEKWKPENTASIFRSYIDLSNSNTGPQTANAGAFRMIIWPESAFPFIIAEQPDALNTIDEMLGPRTMLITGAMRREKPVEGKPEPQVYNSALVLDGDGAIIEARDKVRLVPFGEFLPFQETLESWGLQQLTKQRGGFGRGLIRKPITLEGLPSFLPLICYEVVYPGGLMDESEERPEWIVNLTNDAWFGKSSGPYQHAHQTRVRAVEEGLPIVRVANSGISFVTDAYGRVLEQLPLGAKAVLDTALPVKRADRTVYSRIGNLPIMISICILFLLLVGVRLINTNRLQ